MPRGKQRMLVTPREYVVGEDISHADYTKALEKIGDWYAESRDTKEPAALARKHIDACIKGVKPSDGQPWFSMANSTIAARIRSICRYDIEKWQPILAGSEKGRKKRQKEAQRLKRKRMEQREDPNIPEEIREGLKNTAKYGDNPHVFLSTEEAQLWQEMYDGYLAQFPELRTVNGKTELMALVDLQIHLERMRFKLLKGDKNDVVSPESMATLTRQLADFKKALGIHPEQLAKRAKEDTHMTIGAAVAKLQGMENWQQIRLRYYAEELIQAVQMCLTLKADGSGYQIDEAQFFGLTRCRLVHCPQCGIEILGGFRLKEIIAYLLKNNRLTPLPKKADGADWTLEEIHVDTVIPVQTGNEYDVFAAAGVERPQ